MTEIVQEWLTVSSDIKTDKYRHRLFDEKATREDILPRLQEAIDNAHADAISDLRSVLNDELDPLNLDDDPAHGYPQILHITTLQGYFGEFIAGAVSERFKPFDIGWNVPAYLFRFHKQAVDQLARIKQTGDVANRIPGRPGNDCLAFYRDNENKISHCLCCEAKCLTSHNMGAAADAHRQLSGVELKPVDIRSLIKILSCREDAISKSWCESLRRLLLDPVNHERYDLVCYIAGNRPKTRTTWLPQDKHMEEYTGGRDLEAVEVHIEKVPEFVAKVYRKETNAL